MTITEAGNWSQKTFFIGRGVWKNEGTMLYTDAGTSSIAPFVKAMLKSERTGKGEWVHWDRWTRREYPKIIEKREPIAKAESLISLLLLWGCIPLTKCCLPVSTIILLTTICKCFSFFESTWCNIAEITSYIHGFMVSIDLGTPNETCRCRHKTKSFHQTSSQFGCTFLSFSELLKWSELNELNCTSVVHFFVNVGKLQLRPVALSDNYFSCIPILSCWCSADKQEPRDSVHVYAILMWSDVPETEQQRQ